MLKLVLAALAILPLISCSDQPADPAHAREIAATVKSDCLKARSQAPNAAFARHLDRLCDCSYNKIAAMPLSESDEAHGEKVGTALNACYGELGGDADAEDYRATGLKPQGR